MKINQELHLKEIIKRYVEYLHSIRKISRDLRLQRKSVRRGLVQSGVEIRDNYSSLKLTNQKYHKVPFDGDEKEKAYMVGLVKGDLTPIKKSKYTLRLTVSSTHKNFLNYLKSIFKRYGPINLYPTRNWDGYRWQISMNLHLPSFNFLLKAKDDDFTLKMDKEPFFYRKSAEYCML